MGLIVSVSKGPLRTHQRRILDHYVACISVRSRASSTVPTRSHVSLPAFESTSLKLIRTEEIRSKGRPLSTDTRKPRPPGESSIQARFAPNGSCFGCGQGNEQGLQLQSFPPPADKDDDLVVSGAACVTAEWSAAKQHEAFEGIVSGGIIGTLLDCHMNNTAAYALRQLMKRNLANTGVSQVPEVALGTSDAEHVKSELPCTVTSWFRTDMKRPTPSNTGPLRIEAKVIPESVASDRIEVEGKVLVGSPPKLTATGRGLFVAAKEGHPAFQRW